MDSTPKPTIGDLLDMARTAYEELTGLAEDVEDEWSYINDLAAVWTERIDAVASARGPEPVGDDVAAAVTILAGEAAALDDPHRAIDWLSTFPQVLLIALGEQP
ncbi:MAG: hypothetical protein NVS9B8_18270 [Candidatus Limnocylindrales bacterium]